MGSTNGYVPNREMQVRYLVEWFREFSDMQKTDFLPVLVQRFGNKNYVNGLLPAMEAIGNLEDRPPNLFQCRVKLFMEWTENWGNDEKQTLLNQFKSIDPNFSAKYDKEVNTESAPCLERENGH